MPTVRVADILLSQGWENQDDQAVFWSHPEHGEANFHKAALIEGFLIPHIWNPATLSCDWCGMTQVRCHTEQTFVCTGEPDARAFEDQAKFELFLDRLARAINGEEGMIWSPKED